MSPQAMGRQRCRGVPGRAAEALRGVLSPFPSRCLQGKHIANVTLWRERL